MRYFILIFKSYELTCCQTCSRGLALETAEEFCWHFSNQKKPGFIAGVLRALDNQLWQISDPGQDSWNECCTYFRCLRNKTSTHGHVGPEGLLCLMSARAVMGMPPCFASLEIEHAGKKSGKIGKGFCLSRLHFYTGSCLCKFCSHGFFASHVRGHCPLLCGFSRLQWVWKGTEKGCSVF